MYRKAFWLAGSFAVLAGGVACAAGPVASCTLHSSKDEALVRALAHREITGEYKLVKPYKHVALLMEIYENGQSTEPVRETSLKDNSDTQGRLAVMLADLERLPTVRNMRQTPLQLAPPRSIARLVIMNGRQTSASFAPIDTERLLDLHQGVALVPLEVAAASGDVTPLVAIYQGSTPVVRDGVKTAAELVERNPSGRIVVISIRGSDVAPVGKTAEVEAGVAGPPAS